MTSGPTVGDRRPRLRDLADFRKLLATRLVSQAGDGLFAAGLTWLVLLSPERRQSPEEVAVAAAVLLLPFSVVGPFTGVFLDRWSRRQVLVWGQPVRIGLVAVLVAVEDRLGLVVVYGLAIAGLGVNRFLLAALSAGLPHVVPRELLIRANALAPTAGTAAVVAGFGLGGAILALLGGDDGGAGSAAALLTAAAAFGAASLLARRLGRGRLGPDRIPDRTVWRHELSRVLAGLGAGLRHLRERRAAGQALVLIGTHRFWFGLWTVQVAMLTLHGSGAHGLSSTALVAGASGAGFVTAAVVTPTGRRRFGDRTWVATLLIAGAAAVAGLTPLGTDAALTVAGFVTGLGAQGVKICVDTAVQRHVAEHYLGRAFAIYDVLFNLAFVAAAAAAVVVVPRSGESGLATGLAAGGLATAALWYRFVCHDGAALPPRRDR